MKTTFKTIAVTCSLLLLFAFARANDRLKWTYTTNNRIVAAPVMQGDMLLVGSLDGYLYAIEAATGNTIWKYNSHNQIRTTVVIYNDDVICFESGNTMFGLDLSGNLLWSQTIYSGALTNQVDEWDCFRSSPVLKDSIAYIGSEEGTLKGINVKNGDIVFNVQTPQANAHIETTPAIYNNKIFVGDWQGVFSVFDLASSTLVWQYDTKNDNTYGWVNAIISKPLIYNDTLYFGGRSCNVYAFNPNTGDKIWMFHEPGNMWIFGGPVVSDDVLYAGSSYQQVLYAFEPSKPNLIWQTDVGGKIYGEPVVYKDYIIVGTGEFDDSPNHGSIKIINKNTRQIVDTFEVNGWVENLLLKDGIVYFGCANGKIYAYNRQDILYDGPIITSVSNNTGIIDTMYPNPVTDKLTIQTKKAGQKMHVSISTLTGQTLISVQDKTEIDLTHLKKGVYLATISIDQNISTRKIVKE